MSHFRIKKLRYPNNFSLVRVLFRVIGIIWDIENRYTSTKPYVAMIVSTWVNRGNLGYLYKQTRLKVGIKGYSPIYRRIYRYTTYPTDRLKTHKEGNSILHSFKPAVTSARVSGQWLRGGWRTSEGAGKVEHLLIHQLMD